MSTWRCTFVLGDAAANKNKVGRNEPVDNGVSRMHLSIRLSVCLGSFKISGTDCLGFVRQTLVHTARGAVVRYTLEAIFTFEKRYIRRRQREPACNGTSFDSRICSGIVRSAVQGVRWRWQTLLVLRE